MSSTSYFNKTSLTSPLIVDDKFLGMLMVTSKSRTPEKLEADLPKAVEKAYKAGKGVTIETVAEALQKMGWHDTKALPDTLTSYKTLKVTTPRADDSISLIWEVEDVLWCAKRRGKKISRVKAKEILHEALRDHDCDQGISWGTFDQYL